MVLTDAERRNMHTALIEYLSRRCGHEIAEDIEKRLALPFTCESQTETALERRWATLVRLADRNRELEMKIKGEAVCTAVNANAPAKSVARVPCSTAAATLAGHRDTLTALAFTNNDSFLFSGSEDGTVRMWDVDKMELARVLRGHIGNVSCVAVEPKSEKLLASCSDDCTVRVVDLQTFATTSLFGKLVLCTCCWLRDSESSLLTGSRSGGIRLWNVSQATVWWSLQMPSSIFCIAAPEFDSSVFAAGGKDEVIHCFDASQKKELQTVRVHDNAITALCFGNRDMQLGLLDSFCTSDESKTFSRELKRKINAGELCSPRFVCSGSRDKSTVISDLVVGTVLMRFSDHQNWVRGLAVTPDGAHLVTVSDDGCCNVYNVLGKKRVKSINCHDHFATCVAVRRTGLVMATGSADTTVRVWRFQE